MTVAAVALGALLRFGSAGWGLPYLFHPDEKGFVMWEAMSVEWRGLTHDDWRPRTNTYGPLIYRVAVGLKWLVYGGPGEARPTAEAYPNDWAYLTGAFGFDGAAATDADAAAPYRWPTLARRYRLLAAAMGSLAVWLLALAAGRLAGPRAMAFAAVLAATAPGLVQASHFYTTEAFLMLELAMLAHAAARLAHGGGRGSAVYAGVALGLLAGTKLTGLVAGPAVALAIAAVRARRRFATSWLDRAWRGVGDLARAAVDRRHLLALAVGAAVLFVINPWLFTDPQAYFFDVPENRSGLWHVRVQLVETDFGFYDWRFTYHGTTPYLFHATTLLPYALGGPATALALVALARGVRRLDAVGLIALAYAVPTYVLVGGWTVKALRYVLPMVPGLVLALAALAAAWTTRPRGLRRVGAAVAVAATVWTAVYGIAFGAMFAEPDSRVAAARWLARHARPGDVVVLEPEPSYTAPLGGNRGMVGRDPALRVPVQARYLWERRPEGDAAVERHLARRLRGARFLVLGDFYVRRATHPAARTLAPAQRRFYEAVRGGDAGWRRVATFRRTPRLGPIGFPEDDAEILSVSFDHTGLEIYERVPEEGPPE